MARLTGIIKSANLPLAEIRVEIFHVDTDYGLLGSTHTDINGRFGVRLNVDVEDDTPLNLKFYRGGNIFYSSSINFSSEILTVNIPAEDYDTGGAEIPAAYKTPAGYFTFFGNITSANNLPLNRTVKLYETGFRLEPVLLSSSDTDTLGNYEITIPGRQLGHSATDYKRSLLIRVYNSETFEEESDLITDLKERNEFDFRIESISVTEYTNIEDAIKRIDENIVLSSINSDYPGESAQLAILTGRDEFQIKMIVNANKYAEELEIHPQIFYALLRAGKGTEKKLVLYLKEDEIRSTVDAAIEQTAIADISDEVDAAVTAIKEYQLQSAKEVEVIPEGITIDEVLSIVYPGADNLIANAYMEYSRDFAGEGVEDFWEGFQTVEIEGDPIGEAGKIKIQKGLKLLGITGFQPHISAWLLNDTGAPENIYELAGWETEDWEDLINTISEGITGLAIPNAINPEDEDGVRISSYAQKLREVVQDIYPAIALKAKMTAISDLEIMEPEMAEQITVFLSNNPGFDFRKYSVHHIHDPAHQVLDEEDPDPLYDPPIGDEPIFNTEAIIDFDSFRAAVAPLQRLSRITDAKPDILFGLLQAGVTSASDVVTQYTEEEFVLEFSTAFRSEDGARNAYQLSRSINMASMGYALSGRAEMVRRVRGGGGSFPPPPVGIGVAAQLSTMFGSQGLCGCDHCMSLYSPSAYFVDLLNFIKTRSLSTTVHHAYNELIRRREDLKHIDLTCKNANTPLPYVDIVNELLENQVLKKTSVTGNPLDTFKSYQTNGKAADLAAHPEHVYKFIPTNPNDPWIYNDYTGFKQVYDDKLRNAAVVYPDNLPFNLPLEEVRIYLRHLGYSRYELMKLFKPFDSTAINSTTSEEITEYNLVNEAIGISKEVADIITKQHSESSNPYKFYGFSSPTIDTTTVPGGYISPSDTSVILVSNTNGWKEFLSGEAVTYPGGLSHGGIDIMLQQLRISYKELLQLLVTDFLNPVASGDRKIKLVSRDSNYPDTCELKQLKLVFDLNSTEVTLFFDKLYRFVRFWKAGKLTIYELDIVLKSVAASDIDPATYLLAAKAICFSNQLNIPIERVVTWWSEIHDDHYTNFNSDRHDPYPSLYDKLFRNKSIKNPPDETFDSLGDLSTYTFSESGAGIIAAAGIKERELFGMLQELSFDYETDGMSLPKLSIFYRESLLAKTLNLSIDDYLRFYKLADFSMVTGLDSGSVSPTYAVTDIAARQGLFDSIIKTRKDLKESLFSLDEAEYLIYDLDIQQSLKPLDKDIIQFYRELQIEFKKIVATGNGSTIIQGMLKDAMKQKFSAFFALDADIAEYLLGDLLPTSPSNSTSPLASFITDALFLIHDEGSTSYGPFSLITPTSFTGFDLADMADVYRKVYKIALFVKKLRIKNDLLILLQEKAGASLLNIFDLSKILDTSGNDFSQFIRYINWIRLRDSVRATDEDMTNLIHASLNATITVPASFTYTKDTWLDIVCDLTGWDKNLLIDLVGDANDTSGAGQLKVNYPDNHTDPSLILRIADIFRATDRIGLTSKQLRRKVTVPSVTEYSILWANLQMTDSEKIINASKAKYSEDDWLKLAKPLRDELREKQRQALVSWLIAHPKPSADATNQRWRTENDLYAYLLIDVEMSPCMKTTRIKQAISSVQLFMDRVLMGLEYEWGVDTKLIAFNEDTVKEWKTWRKWYRIWEANRKVFLYPENWIEPELRDGKSPFFEELEAQLQQDEVTDSLVENAYLDYLEKLDGVAKLEPVTNYHEFETATDTDPGMDVVHVIARTYSQPHIYYYRKLENDEWTPWEKIGLDIKGDHVTAVVWNRRLYLFWLTFVEKKYSEEEAANLTSGTACWPRVISGLLPTPGPKQDELKYWNIYLNWSEFKEKKWQPIKISSDKIELVPWKVGISAKSWYSIFFHFIFGSYYDVMNVLRKNNEVAIHEFFKNRLRLFAKVAADNSLHLNLTFAPGLNEVFWGLHSFLMLDSNTEPVVLRDNNLGYRYTAPSSTYFNGMKFIENPNASIDNKLVLDEYVYDFDSYFIYWSKNFSSSVLPPQGFPVPFANRPILDKTGYNKFEVTVKANLDSNPLMNPIYDHFFFEDEKNEFFVRRKKIRIDVRPSELYEDQVDLGASGVLYNLYYGEDKKPFQEGDIEPETDNNAQGLVFSDTTPIFDVFDHLDSDLWQSLYYFQTFYHPHINNFVRRLNKEGLDGLLRLDMQVPPSADTMHFYTNYLPTTLVVNDAPYLYPKNHVEYEYGGVYSSYNWELFFHIPMLVAQRLSDNQQFEQAQKWYHYVFNPMSTKDDSGNYTGNKKRFWRFRPFYEEAQTTIVTLSDIVRNIANYSQQLTKWQQNPFKPHVIARMRIMAYMKNAVMKYLDNIIAWGDQLFSRDTIESINEATNLYILASNILGSRPQDTPARAVSRMYNYHQLTTPPGGGLDLFSNAYVAIENFIDPSGWPTSNGQPIPNAAFRMQYFCLPENDKLLKYWDLIADRLFKIRNCRNIEGVVRELPIYEPPIDPALLVKAAAAGIDMNAVLNDLAGINAPHYRFSYVAQKANEFCSDVKALGNAILSALEKKDAEALALLRSGQELKMLELVKFIRESQINEAEQSLLGLLKTKEVTQIRYRYYSTRQPLNAGEKQHLQSLQLGIVLQGVQGGMELAAGTLNYVPQFHGQAAMAVGASFGGQQLAGGLHLMSTALGIAAGINNIVGTMAVTRAGYERRMDDWMFQAETAAKELEQLDKQIIGSEIRLAIAKKELENHLVQTENSMEVYEFMKNKFTNKELYSWMTTQLASIYFQSYQLAFDMAKKAEKCYDRELPLGKKPADDFIKFGYWDSLKKGLLCGERLQFGLRKMEMSYIEQNKRELELTKNVSLAMWFPKTLLEIKQGNVSTINLPEELFDLDYPGHYNRRIKSISISIPCIAGPYTTVPCTLSLTGSYIRKSPTDTSLSAGSVAAFRSITTSAAQNDNGMFEFNFRDERYLPFEGAGVVSNWEIKLGQIKTDGSPSNTIRSFDFNTISDILLHIKYTANDGSEDLVTGKPYKVVRSNNLWDKMNAGLLASDVYLPRVFSMHHEFSSEWNLFAATFPGNIAATLNTVLKKDHFPFFAKEKTISVFDTYVRVVPLSPLDTSKIYVLKGFDNLNDEIIAITIATSGVGINTGSATITALSINNTIIRWQLFEDAVKKNISAYFDDIWFVAYYKLT